MAVGLSTYAFFWRSSDAAEAPTGLTAMLDETARLGASVFQICDYPAIESMSPAALRALRDHAALEGVTLELGTRGISLAHLERYRELAALLGVSFVRTMLHTMEHKPSPAEAIGLLRRAVPRYLDQGVTLGLETYEQVPTKDLLTVVRGVDSPSLGVCLDPGNCVARLEMPAYVIGEVAPHVVNMHVKDFVFTRQAGWVGFSLTGCPLGTGLLDYDAMVRAVRPRARGVNQIVEHWLPRASSMEETCQLEQEWTRHSAEFLLSRSEPASLLVIITIQLRGAGELLTLLKVPSRLLRIETFHADLLRAAHRGALGGPCTIIIGGNAARGFTKPVLRSARMCTLIR